MPNYVNTLTANYEYSRSNGENWPLPIQMQSEKPKLFYCIFIVILESTLNFKRFEKTLRLLAEVFQKLLTLKDVPT